MAKLFVFAIGGTGSRVMKALTLLLASGVEIKNTDTIIPIVIDPDSANGDLTRTVELLRTYKEIREKAGSEESSFFKPRFQSLDELGEGGFVSDNFKFDIDGVKEQLFREFIGYNELTRSNRAFASLLFSKDNLEADMDVGFKGNPNIGSVVLNKFKDSDFFRKFAANYEPQDRVFIISSIFGGTGAAGFPLILKNIRDAKHPTPHHAFLKDARIGAVTVLPYFSVRPNEDTSIKSESFIGKTRAALSYYAENVSGNGSVNALYYIGDVVTNEQEGADGATKQKNRAHFVELAAAMAIIDFMTLSDTELAVNNGLAVSPKFFEFGLGKETNTVTFDTLANETFDLIARPLTRYALFKYFIDNHFDEAGKNNGSSYITDGTNKLSRLGRTDRLRIALTKFHKHYNDWLNEMATSVVSCNFIDHKRQGADLYNLVNGRPIQKGLMGFLKKNDLNDFGTVLSNKERSVDHLTSEKKLLALFSKATEEIVSKKIAL